MQVPSDVETQRNLEELFNKNQLLDVLRNEFRPVLDELGIDQDPFKVDVICQIYLHKQADVPTMVGLFTPKYGEPQDIADMLVECVNEELLDFNMDTERFILKFGLTEDVEKQLDMYQFPLPMIVPPRVLDSNTMGSGYISTKGTVVLNGSSVFDEEDLCLDHINRANSVPLTLNCDVIASPEGRKIKPVRKPGEDFAEYEKRVKQADVFYDTSMDVTQGLLTLGNTFYLTHKYDRRGRCYCVGYHINAQGTDYNKAVLEMANKEKVSCN